MSDLPPMPGMLISRNPRLAGDQFMQALQRWLAQREFATVAELNAALQRAREDGTLQAMTEAVPSDPAEQAMYYCYQADSEASPQRRGMLLQKALRLDPECAQAGLMQLEGRRLSRERRIARLRELLAMAERRLGTEAMAEHRGQFWGVLETRPYMRVRRLLALELAWSGRAEGAEHLGELLALCPNDNLGLRDDLLAWHLERGEAGPALALLERFPDDGSLCFRWGAVIAHAQRGGTETAVAHCRALIESHPVFAEFFSDKERFERVWSAGAGVVPPDEYEAGGGEEMEYAFCQLGRAAMRTSDFPAILLRAVSALLAPQGRNEACACGSGKKFKRCCGLPI